MITVRFAILLHLISPFSSTLFILFIPINSFSFVCKTLSSLHWTSSCTRLSKTVWWRFHHLSPSMRERPFTQLPISLISRYMSVLTPLTLTPSTFFPPQFLFPFYSSSVLQTLPSIPNYWIPFLSSPLLHFLPFTSTATLPFLHSPSPSSSPLLPFSLLFVFIGSLSDRGEHSSRPSLRHRQSVRRAKHRHFLQHGREFCTG